MTAWYDEPLSARESVVYLMRARILLAELGRESDRKTAELQAHRFATFTEAFDWIVAHRNPLEAVAAELASMRLAGWHPPKTGWADHRGIKRMPRYRPTDRQLEIAMRALDNQKASAA